MAMQQSCSIRLERPRLSRRRQNAIAKFLIANRWLGGINSTTDPLDALPADVSRLMHETRSAEHLGRNQRIISDQRLSRLPQLEAIRD